MERIVNLHIEKLPEGVYLATSEDIPGLVARGRTVTETLEFARDVAKKLLQAQSERQDQPTLQEAGDSIDYPLVLFPPNGFGLFDMPGNVWEWVEDCWHGSYEGAPRDGSAWTHGGDCGTRVLRGGSWYSLPRNLRSANRNRNTTANRNDNNGFRVARTLDGPSRRPHGATGRTTERPGTVIMSEGPAPLLPRSGGEEAPVFVPAHGDHGGRQSPGGTTLRIGGFGLHLSRRTPASRETSGRWNPIGAAASSSGR